MPMIGLAPAWISERSLRIASSRRRLRRTEDLPEIDLLALGIVEAEEGYLLFLRDLAGEMLERRLVNEGGERFGKIGGHREIDVRCLPRRLVVRRANNENAGAHLLGGERLLEPAAVAAAGWQQNERVAVLVGMEIFFVRPFFELRGVARARQRLVPLGHGEIGCRIVRAAAEDYGLA